ncbi:GNAT family N-acetyltransferase [Aeromicrobium sp. CF3.5]|uniref:GNAT family N-acetyltransferase n=1 Tax=Aeromicrobium sp. CF3.5 TaxID=3373078 RepID=UPI003EE70F1F
MTLTLKTVGVDDPVLDDVIALGDTYKRTLGFLPWGGFIAAAARGGILAAVTEDERVAGYCLYDLPGNYVRVTHVCVHADFRGQDVARTLVRAVSDTHQARYGMKLKCRADWPADKMWPHLGFIQRAQVPGRSKEGHLLTIWWRGHGHADLFSLLLEDNNGLRVAVDANVYCDLHSARRRGGAQHSVALAPLVADQQIKVVVCGCVLGELYATTDPQLRQRYLTALDHHEIVRTADADADAIRDELLSTLDDRELERDSSLRADAQFIAESIRADVEVIISRDENAVIQFADYVHDTYDTAVVNPSEIRSVLDATESPQDYLPDQLRHTGYTTTWPQPHQWRWDTMQVFLDRSGSETKSAFTELLRTTASTAGRGCERHLVSDAAKQPRAAWSTRVDGAVLRTPLLRVAPGTLGPTVAKLLVFHLRQVAVDTRCSTIRVDDLHCPRDVAAVLETDGFIMDDTGWTAQVVAECGSWDEVGDSGDLPLATADVAEAERVRWPVRLLGAGIPNYLIPIRGTRASDLLGYPVTLDARPDFLGLSREHVYYKAAGGAQLMTPGRILWFASVNPQEIIGCSRLVETVTGAPNNLHRRFARFGVYNAADVRGAASRSGLVQVLRFADTELFTRPVTLDHVQRLAAAHSKRPKLVLVSAQRIDDELFAMIYRKGTGR